jgi:hypothetical protein
MKSFPTIGFLALLPLMFVSALHAGSTNLLPGIKFYNGPENLTGKLLFLVQHDTPKGEFDILTNSLTAASIYEFNLSQNKLHKVADSPFGNFVSTEDGNTICVNYWLGEWRQGSDTNAFIYSKASGLSRILKLEATPQEATVIVGNHVFFEIQGYDFASVGYYTTTNHKSLETKLIDYDIAKDEARLIEFSDASQWQYQSYEMIYAPSGQSNILNFHYSASGKQLKDGKHYPADFYSLDVQSGKVLGTAEPLGYEDGERFKFKSFDGNYVGFEGNDAPRFGFTLISAPVSWDDLETKPKISGAKIKVLHKFFKLNAIFNGGEYQLCKMSPDHRYALVSEGTKHIYYLVDVSTGKTRVFLNIDTEASTRNSLWNNDVRWVQ